ncbi:Fucose permease [Clostridium cavendishii DSM 21758]|uniref:Fucose permease n=1 Tax=Clostridium cavendishii DSM 21758 TaxID=1121302 RepID=A0A1M6GJP2_9CLOT|nr:MFS transporter [Clostridium cavendishii]SHJ10119.1 Fucose permease [Clostridium cavendishii DSM 21758]
MNKNYKHTMYASYVGYITQAIVNNLAPLLFLTFQKEFRISLEQISLLVTFNFGTQIVVDFLSARFVDKIGYRISIVGAHIFSAVGLIGLAVFPYIFPSPFAGLIFAIALYAIGGGIIEVLISPIVEALPNDAKSSAMSLLHSFYCWGHVSVVIISTIYFTIFGVAKWNYLAMFWAIVPLCNAIWFTKVPINTFGDQETKLPFKKIFKLKSFWLFFILMICSGAAEQAISQWASIFAEAGLDVSKTKGDLLGPCLFAILMGISRAFYGKFGEKINLKKFIELSSVLCVISYLITVFAPIPIISLIGCGLCGLSVGIMWPGVFSLSARHCPQGGTTMFALLALAGDVGCFVGPSLVGYVSGFVEKKNMMFKNWIHIDVITGLGLKIGLLSAIIFPITIMFCIYLLKRNLKQSLKSNC